MGESGVLVLDKAAGETSHEAVARVRRELGAKAGHAGTLDPFATGVLTVLLGRATRLQRYLIGLPKTYLATARLGWCSSTGDPDGELVRTGRIPDEPALPTGQVCQMVPMTSAVRVGGERLYRKAHRGESTQERPVREVRVYRADLVDSGPDTATFEIECSSGTYVRTLIETLEDAYCSALRRTAVGPITLEMAGRQLSPAEALSFLPSITPGREEALALCQGRAVPAGKGLPDGEPIAVLFEGNLLAVARRAEDKLKPEVVLRPEGP